MLFANYSNFRKHFPPFFPIFPLHNSTPFFHISLLPPHPPFLNYPFLLPNSTSKILMLIQLHPFFLFNFISSFFYSSFSSSFLLSFCELEMKSLTLYILSMVRYRDTFNADVLKQCSHGVHLPLNSVYHLHWPQMLAPPFLVSFVLVYKHLYLGGNNSLSFLFLSFLFPSVSFLPCFHITNSTSYTFR